MRKVTCAGCSKRYLSNDCGYYRRKRCCGSRECIEVIDEKVKHANYKKKMNKIKNGTWRTGVDQEERELILERDKHRCAHCSMVSNAFGMMQVHHIVPVSKGGDDSRTNLITLCKWCHNRVHTKGWEEYVEPLRKKAEKVEGRNKASRS